MTYNELSKEVERLSYRDKFRLAQLLIQLARKEEEEQNPQQRKSRSTSAKLEPELVQYVADRLRKLKPSKKEALFNSIGAMFQFQGGISDNDKEKVFAALQKGRHIAVGETQRSNKSMHATCDTHARDGWRWSARSAGATAFRTGDERG